MGRASTLALCAALGISLSLIWNFHVEPLIDFIDGMSLNNLQLVEAIMAHDASIQSNEFTNLQGDKALASDESRYTLWVLRYLFSSITDLLQNTPRPFDNEEILYLAFVRSAWGLGELKKIIAFFSTSLFFIPTFIKLCRGLHRSTAPINARLIINSIFYLLISATILRLVIFFLIVQDNDVPSYSYKITPYKNLTISDQAIYMIIPTILSAPYAGLSWIVPILIIFSDKKSFCVWIIQSTVMAMFMYLLYMVTLFLMKQLY